MSGEVATRLSLELARLGVLPVLNSLFVRVSRMLVREFLRGISSRSALSLP